MRRIAIDMDEVIADTLGHYLERYNKELGRSLTREALHGKRVMEVLPPEDLPHIRQYFQTAEFFAKIGVMPGAQEVVEALNDEYEVFITTSAMELPVSFTPKYEWLREHFPFLESSHFVFCGDKSIINADYLIDDSVKHFDHFRGEGILFTAPHNVNETRFRRVNNWEDVRGMFL
jgi:5'(3')-deoxyribonucleotidase